MPTMKTYRFELDPETLSTDAGRHSWITYATTTCGRRLDLWFTPRSEGYETARLDRHAMKAGQFTGAQVYRGHNRRVQVTGRNVTIHSD